MPRFEIARATEEDVASFSRRRYPDEHAARLYRDLAEMTLGGPRTARDDGTPIAIGFVHTASDECFVSELFVEPSFREQGIGAALLAEILRESDDVARAGLAAAGDSDAGAFAVKQSLVPVAQVLRMSGSIPRENDLLRLAAGDYRFGVQPIDVAIQGFALDALDREVRGTARSSDHAYFSRNATGSALYLNEEFVGYAYVWPSGRIGPIAAVSASYMGQIFAFALAASARSYGATWCTTLVPAANIRAARAALRAGLRVASSMTLLRDNSDLDFARYVAFHDLLV